MSKKDDLEGELSEKASLLASWKSLIASPAWKLYESAALTQRQTRLLMLADQVTTMGGIFAEQFIKGEASGLGLAAKFPQIQIDMLEMEVKRLRMAVDLEEAHEKQVAVRAECAGRVDNGSDWYGGSSGIGLALIGSSRDTNPGSGSGFDA